MSDLSFTTAASIYSNTILIASRINHHTPNFYKRVYTMSNKAIAPGGLILVTGVNGYIASHIADQLLSLGYRVRGTARDSKKIESMAETFRQRHPVGSFEGVVVDDFLHKEAVEKAVEGKFNWDNMPFSKYLPQTSNDFLDRSRWHTPHSFRCVIQP